MSFPSSTIAQISVAAIGSPVENGCRRSTNQHRRRGVPFIASKTSCHVLNFRRTLARTLSIHTLCQPDIPDITTKMRSGYSSAIGTRCGIDDFFDAMAISILGTDYLAIFLGFECGSCVALESLLGIYSFWCNGFVAAGRNCNN